MATQDAIKTELKDFKVYAKLDAEGKVTDAKPVSSDSQFKAYGEKTDYTLAIEQSVRFVKFGTLEAFTTAIPDPVAQLDVVNRGVANKANQRVKEILTELNEDGTNFTFESIDVLDVLEYLQEGPKRQKLTDVEKLINQLRAMNLSEDVIQVMVANVKAAQANTTEDSTEDETSNDTEEVSA